MSDGTVKAGCHTVAFNEIERIAKTTGIDTGVDDMSIACNTCGGSKMIEFPVRDLAGKNCDSIKRKIFDTCPQCNGTGYLTKEASVYYETTN